MRALARPASCFARAHAPPARARDGLSRALLMFAAQRSHVGAVREGSTLQGFGAPSTHGKRARVAHSRSLRAACLRDFVARRCLHRAPSHFSRLCRNDRAHGRRERSMEPRITPRRACSACSRVEGLALTSAPSCSQRPVASARIRRRHGRISPCTAPHTRLPRAPTATPGRRATAKSYARGRAAARAARGCRDSGVHASYDRDGDSQRVTPHMPRVLRALPLITAGRRILRRLGRGGSREGVPRLHHLVVERRAGRARRDASASVSPLNNASDVSPRFAKLNVFPTSSPRACTAAAAAATRFHPAPVGSGALAFG